MMRALIFLSLFILLMHHAKAQSVFALNQKEFTPARVSFISDTPALSRNMSYEATQKLYKKQLTRGIILNTIGGLMLGGGICYFLDLNPFRASKFDNDLRRTLGTMFMEAAAAQIIIGSIELSKWKKTKRQLQEAKPNISFNPILSPVNFTAGAAVRISF